MGSLISTVLFQPLLLGTAITLMIVALVYQEKSSKCGDSTDDWGKNIFNINMGLAASVVIIAVIINFISGLEI